MAVGPRLPDAPRARLSEAWARTSSKKTREHTMEARYLTRPVRFRRAAYLQTSKRRLGVPRIQQYRLTTHGLFDMPPRTTFDPRETHWFDRRPLHAPKNTTSRVVRRFSAEPETSPRFRISVTSRLHPSQPQSSEVDGVKWFVPRAPTPPSTDDVGRDAVVTFCGARLTALTPQDNRKRACSRFVQPLHIWLVSSASAARHRTS